MKTKVYNLIILDESGSMCSIREQAISGVNETIQSIRVAKEENLNQEYYFSLVSFNSKVKTLRDCCSIDDVQEISSESYRPDSMTALYDAMGMSLLSLESKITADDRVLVTIITDGMENASVEFSGSAIKVLVERLKGKGWVFTYIGANHDVKKVAATISIKNTMTFEATPDDTIHMMKVYGNKRSEFFKRISNENGKDFDSESENENFF